MESSSTIATATELAERTTKLLEGLLSYGTACGELRMRMVALLERICNLQETDAGRIDSQLTPLSEKLILLLVSMHKFVQYVSESIGDGMEDGLDARFRAFATKLDIIIDEMSSLRERINRPKPVQVTTIWRDLLVGHPDSCGIHGGRPMISQGAFGPVFRVTNRNDGQNYAVKRVMLSTLTSRGISLTAVAEEYTGLLGLSHSHLARIFATVQSEGADSFDIVMELVEGNTLAEKITCDIVSTEDEIVKWTKQMASALHHMHEYGVLHSNLSPENIMLTAAGDVKIVGLKPRSVQWSVYTSYDRAKGAEYDGRDDVWAVGCMMLELLTRARFHNTPSVITCVTFLTVRFCLPSGFLAPMSRTLRRDSTGQS
jgi:hypothetical protein